MIFFTFVSKHIALSELPLVETVGSVDTVKIPAEYVYEEAGFGTYVHSVESEETILGKQYVVDNLLVRIIDTDGSSINVDVGNNYQEIIIKADESLVRGERVRIAD